MLFVNRVYPPDNAATGQILSELTEHLKTLGWQITVLTSQTDPLAATQEVAAGVRIERVKGLPFNRKSHWRRALSYLSLYPAILWRLLTLPSTDVILTMTDPPLISVLGGIAKLFRKGHLVHWAQDLYPEIAESMGVIQKGGLAAKILGKLSDWGLRQHDQIICIGRCMYDRLIARGIPASAITIIPNWADTENVWPVQRQRNRFRKKYGLGDRPLVIYSGNLGLAHPFEAILDAARILLASMPEARLVFIGDGPRLDEVKARAEQEQLHNILFLPFQPHDRLAESLSAADLHLACMYDELCGLVVPSKVYGVLAAGRPCIFLGPEKSEAARLIQENECGSVLPVTPSGSLLAEEILKWLRDQEKMQAAGERARAAAERTNLEKAALAFDDLLRQGLKVEVTQISGKESFNNGYHGARR